MTHELVLIKLGGSVVTFKDKPLTANFHAIDNISHILASVKVPVILIHGGGSFGHYWSKKYDMHTKPDNYDLRGVSIVHNSMLVLNQIIVNSMIKEGANPYSIMPSSFISGNRSITRKIRELLIIAKAGLIPVTFGDIVHSSKGRYYILSGDALMTMLAKILVPSRIIFTLNVDGLYNDMKSRKIVREVYNDKSSKIGWRIKYANKPIEFSQLVTDVTGGMDRKVREAFKIATTGIDVLMINGLKPNRIINAINGSEFEGTIVKAVLNAKRRKESA